MPINLFRKYHVFISYPSYDGKQLAIETNKILSNLGYKTWFYPHHRTFGSLPWEEISDVILNKTDMFLYLCTISSSSSRGQVFESEYAMQSRHLLPQLILINGATCPQKLSIFNHEHVANKEFSKRMQIIAKKLPNILNKTPTLGKKEKATEIST